MPAKAHLLKTEPEHFAAVRDGRKTFEVRSTADRRFKLRDYLDLREWDPAAGQLTGERLVVRVVYMLEGEPFLPPGLAVMGIERFTGQEERDVLGALAAFGEYAEPFRPSCKDAEP